jgi:uncharacterized protein (TIRG00374 family)
MQQDAAPAKTSKRRRLIQAFFSLVVVIAIFGFALPQFADFGQVWSVIGAMTPIEIGILLLVAAWNLATYWLVMISSLPGSNIWQAMKVNLTSTAVANSIPGGGAIGIGVTYAMYSGYGFTTSEISLSILVTGIWNNFVKLGMPVIALALLAIQGDVTPALVTASLVGVAVLIGAIIIFALILRSARFAGAFGEGLGKFVSALRKVVHKPPVSMRESVSRFRTDAIGLLHRRWLPLTAATIVSHFSLYVVLLVTLRNVGVSEAEISWIQVLAVFAFVRLISALPITPGGVGVVELGLTAGLVAAGGPEAQVVAAVLVHRFLTWALPIGLGLVAYLRWRAGADERRERALERQGPMAEEQPAR